MAISTNKEDWRQIWIKSKAVQLAWDDLDQYDQRMYLIEAEKELNKQGNKGPFHSTKAE